MTFGEKIRYVRTMLEMTQDELASKSGIHPVSIRKYETGKMNPREEQVIRIANALGMPPELLSDHDYSLQIEKNSDNVLMLLIKLRCMNYLIIDGKRDPAKYLLDADSLQITLSPDFTSLFELKNENETISNIELAIKDPYILNRFIFWEGAYYWNKFVWPEKKDKKMSDKEAEEWYQKSLLGTFMKKEILEKKN